MLAQLRNVSLSFPDKKVLEDASLTVYPGDRISLVGENGAGKTSLFRILKGHVVPDSGEVSFARGVRIGYLEQDFAGMDEDPKRTCMETALEPFGGLIQLEKCIERLAFELGEAGRKGFGATRRPWRGAATLRGLRVVTSTGENRGHARRTWASSAALGT